MLKYVDTLYRYAMILTGDPGEAGNLVEETCIYGKLPTQDLADCKSTKILLLSILRNLWLDPQRKTITGPRVVEFKASERSGNAIMKASKGPHSSYVHALECEQVGSAIQRLPLESREVLLLSTYEGLSYQEIAAFLDCSVNMVISLLVNARARLRAMLAITTQVPMALDRSPKLSVR